MDPDRTILHLVKKNIPDPLPLSRIMACTLLSLSYAPAGNIEEYKKYPKNTLAMTQ